MGDIPTVSFDSSLADNIDERNIGQGNFGCIFKPPPESIYAEDNLKYLNDDYVLKVGIINNEEIYINEKIRTVDPDSDYLISFEKETKLKEPVVCDAWNVGENTHFAEGYYMKYGGIGLFNYVTDNITSFKELWILLGKCLECVKVLQSAKVVHDDLYSRNILVDSLGDPRFIDFGLSYLYESRIRARGNVKYKHPIYDRPLFEMIYQDELTLDDLLSYYEIDAKLYFEDGIKYITDLYFENKADPDIFYEKYIYNNIEKIDVYLLGKVFYNMSKDIDEIKDKSFAFFEHLLIRLFDLDVNRQYDVDQALLFMKLVDTNRVIDKDGRLFFNIEGRFISEDKINILSYKDIDKIV